VLTPCSLTGSEYKWIKENGIRFFKPWKTNDMRSIQAQGMKETVQKSRKMMFKGRSVQTEGRDPTENTGTTEYNSSL
jgi:hypothetical protein